MDVVKRIKTEKFRTRGGTKNGFKGKRCVTLLPRKLRRAEILRHPNGRGFLQFAQEIRKVKKGFNPTKRWT